MARTITVKHAPDTDVLAQDSKSKRTLAIQTKTSSSGTKFTLGERDERTYPKDPGWVVLVGLARELERPSFYVVPRCHIAAMLHAVHRWWLDEPGKRGQPHVDNPRRSPPPRPTWRSRLRSDSLCQAAEGRTPERKAKRARDEWAGQGSNLRPWD